LKQNFPNPFNPTTKIRFALPKSSFAKLIVYDVLGKEVKTIASERLNAGIYEVDFDGTDYPSGVYFYTLIVRQAEPSTGEFRQTNKMVLMR
jgi:hypothetical protein